MISRAQSTPCLGERVSGLADGSLRADVRDRALAHTLTCPACRDALDVERLTVERLRSLPQPRPSERLMTALYSLGEPGDPVPPRHGPGPGMARPATVTVGPTYPPRASSSPAGAVSVRPGGTTRPMGATPRGRRTRTFVVAAGALGVGFVAAGLLTAGTSGASGPGVRPPVAQLTVQPPAAPVTGSDGLAGFATFSGADFTSAIPQAPSSDSAGEVFQVPSFGGQAAHQAVVALTRH